MIGRGGMSIKYRSIMVCEKYCHAKKETIMRFLRVIKKCVFFRNQKQDSFTTFLQNYQTSAKKHLKALVNIVADRLKKS